MNQNIRDRPIKILFFIAYIMIAYGIFQTNLEQSIKILLNGTTIIFLIITYICITRRHYIISTLTLFMLIALLLYTFLPSYYNILLKNVGHIKIIPQPHGGAPSEDLQIGVYQDPNATVPVTSIDWGEITPASIVSVYRNVFIKNIGRIPCKLEMYTQNWSPEEASKHMWLSWNYNNMPLEVKNITLITFGLHVNSSIIETGITYFSFDIVIMVTEA